VTNAIQGSLLYHVVEVSCFMIKCWFYMSVFTHKYALSLGNYETCFMCLFFSIVYTRFTFFCNTYLVNTVYYLKQLHT